MRYFYVIICLFFLINTAQARPIDYARDGFPPLRPQHRVIHHAANNRLALLNYRKVTEAEKTILGQTFENQDMNVRLNRLEESVFNRTYPTLSFEQRVNNIIVNYNNTAGNTSYKNLDKYQPEFKFSTWLIRISTNHVIDYRRKKKHETGHFTRNHFPIHRQNGIINLLRTEMREKH